MNAERLRKGSAICCGRVRNPTFGPALSPDGPVSLAVVPVTDGKVDFYNGSDGSAQVVAEVGSVEPRQCRYG
jgi:hypothetical protein